MIVSNAKKYKKLTEVTFYLRLITSFAMPNNNS